MKIIFTLVLAWLLGAGASSGADYLPGRADAIKAMQAGDLQKAASQFNDLAKATKEEWQKADAMAYEAACLQRLGQPLEAMEAARAITPQAASVLCQMKLLKEGRKWNDVLALTGGEVFDQWPESLIFDAYLIRGDACRATNDIAKAEKDYAAARRFTVSPSQKAMASLAIGDLLFSTGPDKALEAYGEVCRSGPVSGGIIGRARLARARLFAQEKEWDKAHQEVAELEGALGKDPFWNCTVQLASGEIYESEGKKKEALERYRKAASVGKASADLLKQASEKIAALESRQKS